MARVTLGDERDGSGVVGSDDDGDGDGDFSVVKAVAEVFSA